MPLKHRLTILKTIMLRRDLSAAAKLLAWFLLCERMNEDTSLCCSRDDRLAEDLELDVSTIERAKCQLRKAGLLDWTIDHSGKIAGWPRASFFRFTIQGSLEQQNCGSTSRTIAGRPTSTRNLAGPPTRTIAGPKNGHSPELPKNDPDAERRIAQGLTDTANLLRAFGATQAATHLKRIQ